MGPKDYRRALVGRWRFIAAALLLGAIGGLALGLVTPAQYTSETTVYLDAATASADPAQASQADALARQRASYYSPLVTQPLITGAVAQRLGDGLQARDISKLVSVENPSDTSLLLITVTDSSPTRAQVVAGATADAVVGLVGRLENLEPAEAPGVSPSPRGRAHVGATVVQPATLNPVRVSTSITVQVALGAAVGLILGVVVAVAREALDHRVHSAEEFRSRSRLVVLGELAARDTGAERDTMARLATALEHRATRARSRSIVLTAPRGGEGTSALVADLARAIARNGRSVAVVDADLRSASLSRRLGMSDEPGLAEVLAGQATVAQILRRDAESTVDVVPAGGCPDEPATVLGSIRLAQVIRDLGDTYDTLLLDVPPMLGTADGSLVAPVADHVVLVGALARTTMEDLDAATSSLAILGVNPLGVVLTRPDAVTGRRRDSGDGAPEPRRRLQPGPVRDHPMVVPGRDDRVDARPRPALPADARVLDPRPRPESGHPGPPGPGARSDRRPPGPIPIRPAGHSPIGGPTLPAPSAAPGVVAPAPAPSASAGSNGASGAPSGSTGGRATGPSVPDRASAGDPATRPEGKRTEARTTRGTSVQRVTETAAPAGPPVAGPPAATQTPMPSDAAPAASATASGSTTAAPGTDVSATRSTDGRSTNGQPTGGETKSGPSKGGPSKGGPSKGGPSKGGPSKGGPSKGGPSMDGQPKGSPSTSKQSTDDQSAKGQPTNGSSAKGRPANAPSANGASAKGPLTNGQTQEGRPPNSEATNGRAASEPTEKRPLGNGQPTASSASPDAPANRPMRDGVLSSGATSAAAPAKRSPNGATSDGHVVPSPIPRGADGEEADDAEEAETTQLRVQPPISATSSEKKS